MRAFVQKALAAEHVQLQELQAIKQELHASQHVVQDLPTRLSHSVCVPFGPHAFFPGQWVDNQCRAGLGLFSVIRVS